ncbi:MAG TPA: DNA-binding protein, partial [Candidatus Nanopelagicales bacterium]|nr:DNA-binding protein [Candidatus Nanopelagicales bacterium]
KSRNAATTLLMLGAIAITMMVSVIVLARQMGVRYVDPHDLDRLRSAGGGAVPEGYEQHPLISQIADAVFRDFQPGFYLVVTITGVILVLAANTAFNGFPVLGSILAQDRYLPRQLHTRGDRLVFSNGILVLAGFAMLLIWAFDASVTRLIQLYIIGVFTSFTLGQLGMVRHWNRSLRVEPDPENRARMQRSRAINATGGTVTAIVLVIVLVEKFLLGAWIVVVAMPIIFWIMQSINRHYTRVSEELVPDDEQRMLPSRVHAIVLVSKVHKPTMRALSYARATRPSTLQAITVAVDRDAAAQVRRDWDATGLPLPITVLDSPYRDLTRPVLDYVKSIRRESPRDLVVVYVPEYVVGHWWERILHNQSALRLKSRLLYTPGVVMASVPWQLASSERNLVNPDDPGERLGDLPGPGMVRRGR